MHMDFFSTHAVGVQFCASRLRRPKDKEDLSNRNKKYYTRIEMCTQTFLGFSLVL